MKAFLLAAGNGTRLRPLTESTPKCLLPIRGMPLLGIWLELCRRCGIDEVMINVHAFPQQVRDYVAANGFGIHVRIFEESSLLGSAGTLAANRAWVQGERAFWVLYADVLTNINLDCMLRFHKLHAEAATLAVSRVPDPERCGIVTVDESNIVTQFIEKPAVPVSDLAFAGLLLGTQSFLDAIPHRHPADIGGDVLPRLANRMSAWHVHDYLLDIGTPRTYAEAQTAWPGL